MPVMITDTIIASHPGISDVGEKALLTNTIGSTKNEVTAVNANWCLRTSAMNIDRAVRPAVNATDSNTNTTAPGSETFSKPSSTEGTSKYLDVCQFRRSRPSSS